MAPDETQDFLIGGVTGSRQILQGIQDDIAILQTAQCQFANHESMD